MFEKLATLFATFIPFCFMLCNEFSSNKCFKDDFFKPILRILIFRGSLYWCFLQESLFHSLEVAKNSEGLECAFGSEE